MPATILLVEDNPITTKLIRCALADAGYTVLEAATGAAALATLEQGPVDLVLVDSGLPDGDGLELLEKIQARLGKAAPLLALTEEADDSRLLGAGFTDVIAKPVDPIRLAGAVRIHLARASADPPGEGRRLLLVDGNPRTLRLAARRFEQLGFDILTAAHGQEALDRLEAARPKVDIVVSELLIGAMDGFELCQAIHARPDYAALPVVLVSAHGLNPVEREFAARVGASATVTRTSDLNALEDAVLDALRPHRRKHGAPDSAPISQDYRRHAISTLEHRVNVREDLARRDGTLRAVRSVLDCLNDVTGQSRDEVLYRALAALLDAMGFALGAAYVAGDDGALELREQIGFSPERAADVATFWGHLQLLVGFLDIGAPRGVCVTRAVGPIRKVLVAAELGAAVVIPLRFGQRKLGVLVLGSRSARLSSDWLVLSETVTGSIANALVLAETATRLTEIETRFAGIADVTTEGIVACDPENQIEYTNEALLRIVGLPSDEVVGRPIDEVLPFVGGAGDSAQGTLTRSDGSTIPCEAAARTVEEPGDRPRRIYVVRDLSERLRLDQMAWLASHDSLTGLYNRHRFEEDLAQRLSESRRYGAGGAVLLLDVDHFKRINDTYGHAAGDSVLRAIAEVLRTSTRESDVAARLGGDEFIVLLPHASLEQARACAAKLLDRLRQLEPTCQGWTLPVSVSIGVAAYPEHGDVAETLVTNADEALYAAKRSGRGRVCVRGQETPVSPSRVAIAPRPALEGPGLARVDDDRRASRLVQNG